MADLSPQVSVDLKTDNGRSNGQAQKSKKEKLAKSMLTEKVTFLGTCVAISLLSMSVVAFQWLVPYIYAVMTPVLVTGRVVMYFRRKWHFFLLDFCYYANTLCMIFLCLPGSPVVFSIVYSLSFGPLICAIPVYWNSLVLHDIDKVTSTYIHILPPLLSFVVRWYPTETSRYWFTAFMPDMPELSPLWMYVVPFLAFVVHSGLYSLLVNYILYSPDNKVSSYEYLGEKEDSKLYCLFNCLGNRCRGVMFYVFNWLFCLLALLVAVVSYYSFHANCLVLAVFSAMAAWNGGSYYVHVFSVRGFVDELE